MDILIILPNQLFDKKYIKFKNIVIYEHEHYFKKYNYNKKKIILHKSSILYYFDYLKKNNYHVEYIKLNEKLELKTDIKYYIFDPIDNIKLPNNITILDNPNFILNRKQYEKYREKTKSFFNKNFYNWARIETNIIPNIPSQDADNRKKLPKNIIIPDLPSNNDDKKYIEEGIIFTNKYFYNNYGDVDNFIYPISHKSVNKWFKNFLKYKMTHFGPYEDAIDKDNNYIFHSVLSAVINIGLINPIDIINILLKSIHNFPKNPKKSIKDYKGEYPLQSLEGYIRQLFWREYQRYCFIYIDYKGLNYFGYHNKLDKKWYNGTLNIEPVDNCIKNGFSSGYLHHIERLMIMGNFMNLSEINPNEGFKWFMEFSCDSYEWVMVQNVYDMVFFVTGGKTMRKPYITSSNYIIKMSNYKKSEWSNKWDKIRAEYLIKYENKLIPYYGYKRQINAIKKKVII